MKDYFNFENNYPKKLSNQNKIEMENLKIFYSIYFQVINLSVKEKIISKEEAKKIKEKLAEEYYIEKLCFPIFNNLLSKADLIIQKGLEKIII